MGVIRITKCGHCGATWERHHREMRAEHGPPHVKCASCGQINQTGLKFAKDMSGKEKTMVWLNACFKTGVLWIFLIGVIMLVVGIQAGNDPMAGLLFFGGSIAYAVYVYIAVNISMKNEKEMIEMYESNGGYISSDWFVSFYS